VTTKIQLNISLNHYSYECGDGCCSNYGTITTVNGVELDCHNEDAATILEQVLEHLGYDVNVKQYDNGEEI